MKVAFGVLGVADPARDSGGDDVAGIQRDDGGDEELGGEHESPVGVCCWISPSTPEVMSGTAVNSSLVTRAVPKGVDWGYRAK